jgi:hypothetical protein
MENLPVLSLGQLTNLPEVLKQNNSLADRAVKTVTEQIAPLKSIDLTTIDALKMEENDTLLASLQTKLKEAYTIMNDRRVPFTKMFDEVKSRFTAEEKKVVAIGEEVKGLRDRWQAEKGRRNQLANQQRQLDLQKQQDRIDCKTYYIKHINDKWAEAIVARIYKMHDAFNGKTIEQLDEYGTQLSAWIPTLDANTWHTFLPVANPKPHVFTQEDLKANTCRSGTW